jgi:hypothetical protein
MRAAIALQQASTVAGANLTIAASDAVAGASNVGAATGGALILSSGAASRLTSGNADGGDIYLTPGGRAGTSARSGVVIAGEAGNTGLNATNGPLSGANSARILVSQVSNSPLATASVMFSSTATDTGGVHAYKSNTNTIGTLAAVSSGDVVGAFTGRGAASTTVWDNAGAGMYVIASQAHTSSNQGRYLQFRVVANGATAQTNAWRFDRTGDFLPETDNSFMIGNTSLRPLSITIGTGTSSFAGMVGVNTTTPTATFTVVGSTNLSGNITVGVGGNITGSLAMAGTQMVLNASSVNVTTSNFAIRGNATASIGGGLLTAGSCTSGNTTIESASLGDVVEVTPQSDPGDGTVWSGFVSATNIVTVKVCTIATLTPTASIYHVRVIG